MSKRRLGVSLTGNTLRDKIELAKLAEDLGYEMVFCSDDPGQETFVALAALATATSTIKIGSGICRAFIRNPIVTASASQNVDELSGGRMILGLATGTPRQNLFQYGIEIGKPVPRLREATTIMRQIWKNAHEGKPLQFDGEYYKISQIRYSAPAAPRDFVPIYLAAVNQRMCEFAGEQCEGMAGHPCYTAEYLKGFVEPHVAKGLVKAGRDRASFDMGRWITTTVSDDREAAKMSCKLTMGNYLATRSYGSLLDFHGWSKEKEAIQDAFFNKRDMKAVANAVTDEIVREMSIFGPPAEAREQLERHWPSADIPVLIPGGGFSAKSDDRYHRTRAMIEAFAPLLK